MKPKANWKETVARHRAQGRGRMVFWALVLGTTLIAGIGLVKGFGHERAGSPHDRHFATAASPEQIADRVDQMLDHLDVTDVQRARITALVDELAPELVQLTAQREALSGQLVERALEIAFQIAGELTPAQRAELIERWDER